MEEKDAVEDKRPYKNDGQYGAIVEPLGRLVWAQEDVVVGPGEESEQGHGRGEREKSK